MKRLQANDVLVNLQELDSRARPLQFTEGTQWLEVRCMQCGPIAHGDQDELEAAETIQTDHAAEFRGHRVNIELFFREVVNTQINQTPKGAGDAFEAEVDFGRN